MEVRAYVHSRDEQRRACSVQEGTYYCTHDVQMRACAAYGIGEVRGTWDGGGVAWVAGEVAWGCGRCGSTGSVLRIRCGGMGSGALHDGLCA